jgi:hypothetical protein
MGIKEKFSKKEKPKKSTSKNLKKGISAEFQEDKKSIAAHAKQVRHLWRSKEIVQLKTDAIAVLWKKRGHEEQFFADFDKITKEGSHMVLSEAVKAIDAGPIAIQIGSYYYFQHRNFIK